MNVRILFSLFVKKGFLLKSRLTVLPFKIPVRNCAEDENWYKAMFALGSAAVYIAFFGI